jgi:hypothetical protein
VAYSPNERSHQDIETFNATQEYSDRKIGPDFGEDDLKPGTGTFNDASKHYRSADEFDVRDLQLWLIN